MTDRHALKSEVDAVAAAGGTTWLSGSGAPSNATGSDGNYYEDTTNGAIYGPKAAGAWPTGLQVKQVLTTAIGTQAADYTTSSTSFVSLDATNLTLTFVAPPSGKVLIRARAIGKTGASGDSQQWELYDKDAAADIAATAVKVTGLTTSNIPLAWEWLVTGLTPGTTYHYEWRWRTTTSTTQTIVGKTNGLTGSAPVMVVLAA